MTRARSSKSIIRARMAKTGERYTTARRHVLASGAPKPALTQAPPSPRPAAAPPAARGGVNDSRVVERTGRNLTHWFHVLDRFAALEKGHTASARHLREEHGVDGWYSQSITGAYERVHGGRSVNQGVDGVFSFGASKIVAAGLADVRAAFTAPRRRARWTTELDPELAQVLAAGVSGRRGRGFVPRSQGQTSCRFPWGTSAVELLLTPRADGRTLVYVTHGKLRSREEVERHRRLWRPALAALAADVGAATPRRRARR